MACSVFDCARSCVARGLCAMHYQRFRKNGSPLVAAPREQHGAKRMGEVRAEYSAWQHMKNRCLNRNCKDYPYYGGRGISVCDPWVRSFSAFLADMGERPGSDMTLDRIDPDGNYEPGNCRWATRKTQSQNRRPFIQPPAPHSKIYEHMGQRLTLTEWSAKVGIERSFLRSRIKKGWSIGRAISVPFGGVTPTPRLDS